MASTAMANPSDSQLSWLTGGARRGSVVRMEAGVDCGCITHLSASKQYVNAVCSTRPIGTVRHPTTMNITHNTHGHFPDRMESLFTMLLKWLELVANFR